MISQKPKYRRVLLKLSGEGLMGENEFGFDPTSMERIANEVKTVREMGVEVCMVIGAGNIFRGLKGVSAGLDRSSADYMGMLATVMNAIGVQSVLEKLNVTTRVLSAIPMSNVCEPYIRRRAERHLKKGRVVIFAAGTGNPYFTTDTAAALRAAEMNCDALFKGTQVDGVYTGDPKEDKTVQRYDTLTYLDVLSRDLKVMDASAIALARDNKLPIIIFSLLEPNGLLGIIQGKGRFTRVES